MSFEIDADIRIARTLPGRVYSDPELFRQQRERIFARTWHYVAHSEALKVPATGGIGLEADRGQMEYRNLRLKETK